MQTEQAQRNDSPEDVALFLYQAYLPEFKKTIKKLSSRARARVMNALIEYPLDENKYHHSNPDEKRAMAIGHSVLEAKFILIMSQYSGALEELSLAADPEVPNTLTDEEQQYILDRMEVANDGPTES